MIAVFPFKIRLRMAVEKTVPVNLRATPFQPEHVRQILYVLLILHHFTSMHKLSDSL